MKLKIRKKLKKDFEGFQTSKVRMKKVNNHQIFHTHGFHSVAKNV